MEKIPRSNDLKNTDHDTMKPFDPPNCIFINPDTSVSGIVLRNAESVIKLLGHQTQLEAGSNHSYFSADRKQKLVLTVYPADYPNQISVMNVSHSDNTQQEFRQLNIPVFKTEKGIQLGMSRKEIVEKLGFCYLAKDSTKNTIDLAYRIELPNDSNTKFLERNNMPIYYAIYSLVDDKLKNIEIGFENP
ncbi:MAG: hypothetical protein IPM48_09105 [Saprospiraceae bacterium]|nr:hypothetical protein [Saprospiraceae bacterium]